MQPTCGDHAPPLPSALLDQLYNQRFDGLVRYASRITGWEKARAEDIVQEAFSRLIQTPPRDLARAADWLRIVVQRLCYDQLRQKVLELSARGLELAESQPQSSAEDAVVTKVDCERVNLAMSRLNPREARALWLRHTGYSYREIARELGLDPTQVGMLLLRAMKKLKEVYFAEEGR